MKLYIWDKNKKLVSGPYLKSKLSKLEKGQRIGRACKRCGRFSGPMKLCYFHIGLVLEQILLDRQGQNDTNPGLQPGSAKNIMPY